MIDEEFYKLDDRVMGDALDLEKALALLLDEYPESGKSYWRLKANISRFLDTVLDGESEINDRA